MVHEQRTHHSKVSFKLFAGLALMSLWVLSGCALNSGMKTNEAHSFGDGQSITAFQNTVYPIVKEHCAACHATLQSPMFASDDVNAAYQGAVAAINFANPAGSRLVERLGTDQHNCWTASCSADATYMRDAIEEWIAETNGGGGSQEPARINLTAQAIPAPLPTPPPTGTNNSYTTMTFPLSSVGLGAATFSFDIQSFSAQNYQIRNLKIDGLTGKAQVKSVRFYINGLFRPNEGYYTTIDTTLAAPGGSLSTVKMLVLKDKGEGVDTITPSFEILEPAP